jgi:hypothetical protein
MAKHLSSGAVQAAIRTKLCQDKALERGDFETALGGGLVAEVENRKGFHAVNPAQERRENRAK